MNARCVHRAGNPCIAENMQPPEGGTVAALTGTAALQREQREQRDAVRRRGAGGLADLPGDIFSVAQLGAEAIISLGKTCVFFAALLAGQYDEARLALPLPLVQLSRCRYRATLRAAAYKEWRRLMRGSSPETEKGRHGGAHGRADGMPCVTCARASHVVTASHASACRT